jgi:hypothetical protein
MNLKYALVALLLLPFCAQTEGTTGHVSFTFATEAVRTDPVTGVKTTVPLALSDIASTTIQWFVGTTKVGEKVVTAPAAAVDIPGLICGNYDFKAFHTHKQGSVGELSNTVAYATEVACTVPKGPSLAVR